MAKASKSTAAKAATAKQATAASAPTTGESKAEAPASASETPANVPAGTEVLEPAVTVSPDDASKATATMAEAAPAEAIRDAITGRQEAEADPSAPVEGADANLTGQPADPFAKADPVKITEGDVATMDFDAIVQMGLESIDEMDADVTKSGALADARQALIHARDLVAGFQSGKLA